MINNFCAICFLLISLSTANAQVDPTLAEQLQIILESSVVNDHNHGVSAHVIMPDGTKWSGTAGVGHEEVPISDTTVFHGASTTKMNIAILMLMLAEEGLIDLDASWQDYITLPVNFNPSITIRQLLNHSSGIADYLETSTSGSDITSDFDYFFTPQYILENIVSDAPLFAPGTGFRYSNSNYVLAALIIEAVTGHAVHVELRNRIWNPLDMSHTYFGGYETFSEPKAGVWWNFGSGQMDYSHVSTNSMLSYAYGAGNIVSCPTDLASLMNSLINHELLQQESLNELLTFVPESYNSWTAGYGLGIHHYKNAQGLVVGHDGYYTNLTDMFYSMNHDFTLVTMTNTQTNWFGVFEKMYAALVSYFQTTGTSTIENSFHIKLFPNPTKDQLCIYSEENIEELEIRDVMGRLHFSGADLGKRITLPMHRVGLFVVQVKSGERVSAGRVLVE